MIKLLGKYELHEQLGKGGFGTVFRATDTVLGVDRALKVLHPALVADDTFISRFKQEAQIAARLEHPNLVPVYDFGETDGRYYLAMKYMPGGSLKDLLVREGKLDQEHAFEILRLVAEGIGFAHKHNIIHRDLKPGNILFDRDGSVRISDMGFAKALAQGNSASLSATGGMIGTPSYMAPEIWRGKPALPASDIYSLGCILYEMLTGKVLFEGESPADVMTKHVLDSPKLIEELPGVIAAFLTNALAKDPEDRFDNARGFIDAVDRINQTTKKNGEVVPEEILSTEIHVDDPSVFPEKEIVGTQASEKITEQEKIKDIRQQNIEPSALQLKYVSPYNQSREEGQPQSNTWKWVVLRSKNSHRKVSRS